jgi:hypothetical protein
VGSTGHLRPIAQSATGNFSLFIGNKCHPTGVFEVNLIRWLHLPEFSAKNPPVMRP